MMGLEHEQCDHERTDVDVAIRDGDRISHTVTTYCCDCGTVLGQVTRT